MGSWIQKAETRHSPRSLADRLRPRRGLVLLESTARARVQGRYSMLAVEPPLTFRSAGARCELLSQQSRQVHYGNPWRILDRLMERFDLSAEQEVPFPTGGCFGFWGYELRQFVEPKLRPHPVSDLAFPDCWVGFYDSLVVFDHETGETWVISTGLGPDGARSERRASEQADFWRGELATAPEPAVAPAPNPRGIADRRTLLPQPERCFGLLADSVGDGCAAMTRDEYIRRVVRAKEYIRQGDVYQVNLAQRWRVEGSVDGWDLYCALAARSPAPFAAYIRGEDFGIVSASPELFLRFDGPRVLTRPIKGTRPRGAGAVDDAALAAELCASPKEQAELTMITDLLRNDLGRVCEFGSVRVPELARLERFAQVQHRVSTVEGQLRGDVTQVRALEACFPGGSVTGAPKFRAMQIIDELEPVGRGPYTGCLGYLGFNRRSQLSIIIRAAFCDSEAVWFQSGAGIVADSQPAAEHAETLAKVSAMIEILDTGCGIRAHLVPFAPAWAT